ncbi:MAG: Gfo/Idh/MocA family protein [Planctomycetota bacterium]
MSALRFAILGTGYWSRFQLAGWRELEGAECVALCNRTRSKAVALGEAFGIDAVYDDPEELLRSEDLNFLDIITSPDTHPQFVALAARHGVPVICQKPMAESLEEAEGMVRTCREAGVPFYVHENWRWQAPIRAFKRAVEESPMGPPFRAEVKYLSSAEVWRDQPFLEEVEQFILLDMGSHILDVTRFLFGEAEELYCHTHRVNEELAGEDVATVVMRMGEGATVTADISYASVTEYERGLQTYGFVQGEGGSVELGPGYRVHTTTERGTQVEEHPPPDYPWAAADRPAVHASIVDCNANLLAALRGEGEAETTGEDNLRTARLVFAAYRSAATGRVLRGKELSG